MIDASDRANLPPDWAFVVQLRGGTSFAAALLCGRVEHVASGRACDFESLEALRVFMEHVMALPPTTPPGP